MAITNTQLLDAVVLVGDRMMGKNETRLGTYGVLKAFQDNADKLLDKNTIEKIKQSARQPVKVPVLNKFSSSLVEARSCSITGNRAASAFKQLSWGTVGFEATVIPSVNDDNFITVEADLANQIQMGLKTVLSTLDTRCATALETNKSAVLEASKNATAGSGAYEIAKALEKFFIYAPAIMSLNDLEGPFIDICNSEAAATLLHIETLSKFNQQNLDGTVKNQLTMAADYQHYMSNRIDPGENQEVHYLMPEGVIGIYNWIDKDSQIGRQAGNKKWYKITDPIFGFDWGVFQIDDCADASSEHSGNTAAYAEKYKFVADFAIVTDYTSDTSSPIIKFNLNQPA